MYGTTKAAEDSQHFNQDRLNTKANTNDLEVGDQVMIEGQHLMPLTSKWDHHFWAMGIRGTKTFLTQYEECMNGETATIDTGCPHADRLLVQGSV